MFDNDHPDQVWTNACEIIRRINPNYDFALLSSAFRDVVGLFYGEYPGYLKVDTLYHDLRHTMDVFMCLLRLMHGTHLSGNHLNDDEITIGAIAALMHDVGYAKKVGDETGTGAKYTTTHVSRGIAFMRNYAKEKKWSSAWVASLECAMRCTDPAVAFTKINFPNERSRLLGKLVGTADLVGQMADRSYLEKLLFLYFEFKEANLGDFKSMQDLLQRTREFYILTGDKLEQQFGHTYEFLLNHFMDWFGVESNYYMESINKNIAYLAQVLEDENDGEDELFHKLKRRGIAEQVRTGEIWEWMAG